MAKTLRLLFVGDVVGDTGVALFRKWLPSLIEKYKIDSVVVNGENSAKSGCGITLQSLNDLKNAGASMITLGNHAWDSKDVYAALNERADVVRPLNYPADCPGKGYNFITVAGHTIAIVNLHGRVFIKDMIDCPFKAIDSLLTFLKHKTPLIFVDFHAEATSEKKIMALHLDGRISGIYGTHTHVQTADELILPKGTSFITDLGCCGAVNSVIGMEFESAFKKMVVHHKFGRFVVDTQGPFVLSGVCVEVDTQTGKSISIERISLVDNDMVNQS